jgi:hypothetical protein
MGLHSHGPVHPHGDNFSFTFINVQLLLIRLRLINKQARALYSIITQQTGSRSSISYQSIRWYTVQFMLGHWLNRPSVYGSSQPFLSQKRKVPSVKPWSHPSTSFTYTTHAQLTNGLGFKSKCSPDGIHIFENSDFQIFSSFNKKSFFLKFVNFSKISILIPKSLDTETRT